MSSKRFVIIGDGAAGTTAAHYLRALDPNATITILSDDPHPAYFRAALTNYLLGALRTEQIFAVPPSFYDELRIHRVQARVASIEPASSQLVLAQGTRVPYDALLIATGSRCRPPFFEGWWHPGIMTMRTLSDVNRVIDLVKSRALRSSVIVGGGPLALEWAHGLAARGVAVTMVVRETRFLQNAIDGVASDLLHARLRRGGVDVRMSDEVAAALPGPDGRVQSVALRSGARLPCDLLAVAIGVICNSELVAKSSIEVGANGGIEVDAQMQTNVPNIFAAGDVATFEGKLLQLWEPARTQGRIAAFNMLGTGANYTPGAHYMATRLYDLDCASVGDIAASGQEEVVDFPQGTGKISYRKLALRDHRLVGALMFGEREAQVRRLGRAFKRLIDAKIDVRPIKDDLLDPSFDLPAWLNKNVLLERPQFRAAESVRIVRAASPLEMSSVGPNWDPTKTAQPTPEQLLELARAAAVEQGALPPMSVMADSAFSVFDMGPPPSVTIDAPKGRFTLGGTTGRLSAIIGRDPACAILVEDRLVSSEHAEITITGQSIYVRDLGSSNGTWVAGVVVTTPRRLRNGDKMRVGATDLGVTVETAAGRASGAMQPQPMASALSGGPLREGTPYLEIRTGRAVGLSFALTQSPVTIGRDASANIYLSDEWIDQHHATLRQTQTGWEIADAKSHGVTKQNGHVLPAEVWVPLKPNDLIEVGYVQIAYVMKGASGLGLQASGLNARPSDVPMSPRHAMAMPARISDPPQAASPETVAPRDAATRDDRPPATVADPSIEMAQAAIEERPPATVADPPAEASGSGLFGRPRHAAIAMPARASTPSPALARLSMPNGVKMEITTDVVTIGTMLARGTLLVSDPLVAPRHVEIVKKPDGYYAVDLGTRLGTRIRGTKLGSTPVKLVHGDVLELGIATQVLFEEGGKR